MTDRTLTVSVPVRPFSLNAERNKHWSDRSSRTNDVRGWAKLAAIQAMGGKHLAYFREPVRVIVEPWALNRRYRHDVGNCYPSFKAVLDGCVDAGVITDDSDSFIFEVVFRAHQFGRDEIALTFMEGG